jgi:sulfur carrier protein
MIEIKLNGKQISVQQGYSLYDVLINELKKQSLKGIAVAVNESIVPKQKWESVILNHNDSVEVVHAVQGG